MRACLLVVEDEDDIRAFLTELLTEEGYEVHAAPDGARALAAAAAREPTLFLLDLDLPDMPGDEIVAAHRAGHAGCVARVIVVSALGPRAVVAAEKVEADARIAKPFEIEELLQLVRDVIARA